METKQKQMSLVEVKKKNLWFILVWSLFGFDNIMGILFLSLVGQNYKK